jgi:hypothetical protein
MNGHPSFLQLDRFALGAANPQVAAHVEDCATCRAQVSRAQQSPPVPAWVGEIRTAKRLRRAWWLGGLGAVAAVAVVLMIAMRPPRLDGDTGAKGAPSVAIYVKRGEAISLWDGRAPFAPGEAFRVKISPQGFERVAIASLRGDALTELYAAPVNARGESVLPPSWTLDSEPGPEVLLLVFSHAPLSEDGLRGAAARLPRTREVWATRLTLTKSGGVR